VCYSCAIDNVFEIEPRCLRLDEIIGEGQFGDVCRGTYTATVCISFIQLLVRCYDNTLICSFMFHHVGQLLLRDSESKGHSCCLWQWSRYITLIWRFLRLVRGTMNLDGIQPKFLQFYHETVCIFRSSNDGTSQH